MGQDEISNSNNNFSTSVSTLITILGLIASLVISVLNAFMSFATRKLVNIEKHATQTEFNISYAYKLGIVFIYLNKLYSPNSLILPSFRCWLM